MKFSAGLGLALLLFAAPPALAAGGGADGGSADGGSADGGDADGGATDGGDADGGAADGGDADGGAADGGAVTAPDCSDCVGATGLAKEDGGCDTFSGAGALFFVGIGGLAGLRRREDDPAGRDRSE